METTTKPLVKMDRSSRRIYKSSKGEKLPGVTTILNCISKPQLMIWAAKEERKGVMDCMVNKKILPEKLFYTMISEKAADVGTICHFMCECYLKGCQADVSEIPGDQLMMANIGFNKFLEFWNREGLTVASTEEALVDSELGYGGTLDIVCTDREGKFVLVDLKTSKAIYSEYWAQVSAYKKLFDVNSINKISRCIIVRIGKEKADDLEVEERNELDKYYQLFEGARLIYNAQKEIGK